MQPLSDPRDEVVRVLDAADDARVVLRAVGGLGVYLRCPSARTVPLAREYKDIDLVGHAGDAPEISRLLRGLGYVPDEEFNALHGRRRLFFWDAVNERQLDVFIEAIVMSHELQIGPRLELDNKTLTLADLLLTKLQVFEINDKDLRDAAALLADHEVEPSGIDPERISGVLCNDWGWWRTSTSNLDHIPGYVDSLKSFDRATEVRAHTRELRRRIDESPKTLRWKVRARVGERLRWYELPEELEG